MFKKRILRSLLAMLIAAGMVAPGTAAGDDEPREKIKELEAQLARKKGRFDWALHNELRHYYGAVDRDREFHHINVILKHSLMDDYMMKILAGWEIGKDRAKAIENLRQIARKRKKAPLVVAACWIKAGELENSGPKAAPERARQCFRNALGVKGDDLEAYHHLAGKWLEELGPPPRR
jgi:hypothetical protein